MKKEKLAAGSRILFLLPLALIVILFECVPLGGMVLKSITDHGTLTMEYFHQILEKPVYTAAIKNSLWIALSSTIVGLIVDFFLALALSSEKGRKKTWYLSLLNLTSTFSGIPLAIAFITALGTSGVFVLMGRQAGINWLSGYNLYSMKGMFLVYLYFQIPMGTLLLLPAFEKVRKGVERGSQADECWKCLLLDAGGDSGDDAWNYGNLQYAVFQCHCCLRYTVSSG